MPRLRSLFVCQIYYLSRGARSTYYNNLLWETFFGGDFRRTIIYGCFLFGFSLVFFLFFNTYSFFLRTFAYLFFLFFTFTLTRTLHTNNRLCLFYFKIFHSLVTFFYSSLRYRWHAYRRHSFLHNAAKLVSPWGCLIVCWDTS